MSERMQDRYTVRVVRWEHGWELHLSEVDVTQVAALAKADRQVRDYLATMYEGDAEAVELEFVYSSPVAMELLEAKRESELARLEQVRLADRVRSAVVELVTSGVPQTDVAAMLNVTKARITQIIHSAMAGGQVEQHGGGKYVRKTKRSLTDA